MKTLKVLVCAIFVMFVGVVFVACRKDKVELNNFDENKIIISEIDEFTYDGNSHSVAVAYEGVDVDVTYALFNDKDNFKSLEDLPAVNAGIYNVYYRLSANGYNSFTSSGTIEFEILPKTLEIIMQDYVWFKSNPPSNLQVGYTSIGIINNENIGLSFSFGEDFDAENVQYGEEYDITCSITNSNYNLAAKPAKLYVKDYVSLNDSQGNFKSYYATIQDAIENALNGDTIVLNDRLSINKTIEVDKEITIDGQGKYDILAESNIINGKYANQDVASLFMLANSNAKLTLKDIVLDGSEVVRGVTAFAGSVIINGAVIKDGKRTDTWRSGGVFITNAASFYMTSGEISGNDANDTEYTKYCADLWIGANAQGSLASISGGMVENLFINANSYSATNAGGFTMNGGNIKNIYVEYDSGYGAIFEYKTGNISTLMISLPNEDGVWGVYEEVTPVENTTYIGGKIDYSIIE